MRYINVTFKSKTEKRRVKGTNQEIKYWEVIITYDDEEEFIKKYYDESYAKSIYYELSQLLNDNYTE